MKNLLVLPLIASIVFAAPALARKGSDDVYEGGHKSSGHHSSESYDDNGGDRNRSSSSYDDSSHSSMSHSPAIDYYAPAMETMHNDMMVEPTGNADVDFVRGMIPHHQGAIDMAKILKEKGKDPELQSLADGIIAAQEKEIAFMKDWLKRHGQ